MARSNLLDGFAYGVINEILAGFRTDEGLASPSRYEVILYPPPNLGAIKALEEQRVSNKELTKIVSLETTAVSFPGMSLETQEDVNIYGPVRNVVVGQTFANINTQIRLSQDHKERNYIDNWQRLAANRADFSVGYYEEYVGSMQIFQLDRNNRRRHGVELLECFPVDLQELSLDYATNNLLSFATVSWSYRYWKNLTDEADLPKPLLERISDVFVNTVERQIRSRIPAVLRRL